MAKKRSGAVRFLKGRWRARVTLGPKERPSFSLPAELTEADAEEAAERAVELSTLAEKMIGAALLPRCPAPVARLLWVPPSGRVQGERGNPARSERH